MKRRSELYREMFEDPQPNLETHQIVVVRSVSDQRKYFKFYTLLLLKKDYDILAAQAQIRLQIAEMESRKVGRIRTTISPHIIYKVCQLKKERKLIKSNS